VNRPEELWTLIRILGLQKHFGSKESYERTYASGGIKELQHLNKVCRDLFMVRRTKDQVLTDLPPKVYHEVPVELSNREAYDKAEADLANYIANRKIERQEVELMAWRRYAVEHDLGDDAPSGFEGYTRVLEIVGADEAAKTLGRSRWRRYREHGANPESHNL